MNNFYQLLFEYRPLEGGYFVKGIDSDSLSVDVTVPSIHNGKPVVGVGEYAFDRNYRLVRIVLPSTIRKICANAFSFCLNLKEVVLPPELEVLAVGVFLRCSNLSKINLPKNLKKICQMALFGAGLDEVVIPSATTEILPEALPSRAILRALPGTYGEVYARRHGFRFQPLRRSYFKKNK